MQTIQKKLLAHFMFCYNGNFICAECVYCWVGAAGNGSCNYSYYDEMLILRISLIHWIIIAFQWVLRELQGIYNWFSN
jgi:hypothetical protein